MPKLKDFKVKLNIPFTDSGIEGTWTPDDDERRAAWELYVELVTRITVVGLKPDEGLVREAMESLYSLFDTTRKILRDHGPGVAKPKRGGDQSFGTIAVVVLSTVIRPFLAQWHPRLSDWEAGRRANVSVTEHEAAWRHNKKVRKELREVQGALGEYADLLALVAGVPALETEART